MTTKVEKKLVKTKVEKKLEKEIAALKADAATKQERAVAMAEDIDAYAKSVEFLCATLDRLNPVLSEKEHALNVAHNTCRALHQRINQLEQTRQISADGMVLERAELLNRAERLGMRVRGLGFDVELS